MSDNLKGLRNVEVDGLFGQYINLEGNLNTKLLKGKINQQIKGSINVEIKGKQGLNISLFGSSFFVNLKGTVGARLSGTIIRASSTNVLASDDTIRASNG